MKFLRWQFCRSMKLSRFPQNERVWYGGSIQGNSQTIDKSVCCQGSQNLPINVTKYSLSWRKQFSKNNKDLENDFRVHDCNIKLLEKQKVWFDMHSSSLFKYLTFWKLLTLIFSRKLNTYRLENSIGHSIYDYATGGKW